MNTEQLLVGLRPLLLIFAAWFLIFGHVTLAKLFTQGRTDRTKAQETRSEARQLGVLALALGGMTVVVFVALKALGLGLLACGLCSGQ